MYIQKLNTFTTSFKISLLSFQAKSQKIIVNLDR